LATDRVYKKQRTKLQNRRSVGEAT